jgi:hypothetical protein
VKSMMRTRELSARTLGLEIKQSRDNQRSAEAKDSLSRLGAGDIFNDKGIRRHYEILVERRSLKKYEFFVIDRRTAVNKWQFCETQLA